MLLPRGSSGILPQNPRHSRDQFYVPKPPGIFFLIGVPGKGWVLCGIYGLLWHVGPGPRVLSQNRRAAAQLGLRDEQYIPIMATHFLKLQMGSGHVQGNTLWERGGRRTKGMGR